MSEVYLNGEYVGNVENGKEFVYKIISERRKNSLSHNINVFHNEKTDEIMVEAGKGRVRRPLIIVKNGQPLLTEVHIKQLQKNEISWNDLIEGGIVEYLDAAEEENLLVAFNEEDITETHTHLEITPLSMLGLVGALVPYGNYTQPARLSIGAKNQKQSLGYYAANFGLRMD